MEAQLSDSLGAPGQWVPEDWRWRPSWMAEALLRSPEGEVGEDPQSPTPECVLPRHTCM